MRINPINCLHARKLDGTHKMSMFDCKKKKRERISAFAKANAKRKNEERDGDESLEKIVARIFAILYR